MKKQWLYKTLFVFLLVALTPTLTRQALATAFASPGLSIQGKALTPERAIASRPAEFTPPGLSVSGINIVANGQLVRLHGVSMGDPFWARNPAWYPQYSTADYADLAQNWGANVVRISIFPTQWKNMDHAALLAGLAQEVDAA